MKLFNKKMKIFNIFKQFTRGLGDFEVFQLSKIEWS